MRPQRPDPPAAPGLESTGPDGRWLDDSSPGRRAVRENHRRAIERLTVELEDDPRFLAVILGGSVARGTELPDSDIDLILVASQEEYTRRLAEMDFGYLRHMWQIVYNIKCLSFLNKYELLFWSPIKPPYVEHHTLLKQLYLLQSFCGALIFSRWIYFSYKFK